MTAPKPQEVIRIILRLVHYYFKAGVGILRVIDKRNKTVTWFITDGKSTVAVIHRRNPLSSKKRAEKHKSMIEIICTKVGCAWRRAAQKEGKK